MFRFIGLQHRHVYVNKMFYKPLKFRCFSGYQKNENRSPHHPVSQPLKQCLFLFDNSFFEFYWAVSGPTQKQRNKANMQMSVLICLRCRQFAYSYKLSLKLLVVSKQIEVNVFENRNNSNSSGSNINNQDESEMMMMMMRMALNFQLKLFSIEFI